MNESMMAALTNNNQYENALDIYNKMNEKEKDSICHALAVNCCTILNNHKPIEGIENVLNDCKDNIPIQTSLIDYYGTYIQFD